MPNPIPKDDHVVRYVRKRLLLHDDNNNVIGVLPQAFEHRVGERYLSLTWLEHFDAKYESGLSQAAAAMRRQLTVKPRDGFTVGQVDDILTTCSDHDRKVRVLHEPEPPENTGHGALRGLRGIEDQLLDLLAVQVFTDTRESRDIA